MNPCPRPHKLLEETETGAQGLVCPPVLQRVSGPFSTQRMDAEVGGRLCHPAVGSDRGMARTTSQEMERGQIFTRLGWAQIDLEVSPPEEGMGSSMIWEARHLFSSGWQG